MRRFNPPAFFWSKLMDQSFKSQLKTLIVSHEEKRNYPYTDMLGNVTIGIGYNLSARGLPDSWINEQFDQDIAYFDKVLTLDFPWYEHLCDARKMVIIDMCFMGYKTFRTFHKMLFALELHNYERAADEMLNSEWAHQVNGRAVENALIMRRGALCSPQV